MKAWEKELMLFLRNHREQHPQTFVRCNEVLAKARPRHADILDYGNYWHKHGYIKGVNTIQHLPAHDSKGFGIFYDGSGSEISFELTLDGDRWLSDELAKEKTWKLGTIERWGVGLALLFSFVSMITGIQGVCYAKEEREQRLSSAQAEVEQGKTAIEGSIQQRTAPVPLATPPAACDTISP